MVTDEKFAREKAATATLRYLGLAILAILAGLILRLVPLDLPFWLTKWGGSMLWAMMVYWLVALMLPGRAVWVTAGLAGLLSTLVELSRLYHSPGLDAFRHTMAGILLLGNAFTGLHIAVYWGAVVLAAGLDGRVLGRRWR
jgi:hypothetical protein